MQLAAINPGVGTGVNPAISPAIKFVNFRGGVGAGVSSLSVEAGGVLGLMRMFSISLLKELS